MEEEGKNGERADKEMKRGKGARGGRRLFLYLFLFVFLLLFLRVRFRVPVRVPVFVSVVRIEVGRKKERLKLGLGGVSGFMVFRRFSWVMAYFDI